MLGTISYYVARYGYKAIFSLLVLGIVGLPVPDEWLLTFAGYLIYKGTLSGGPAYAAAAFGSMCGITISYILGRSIGSLILHHLKFFHVTPQQIARVHSWFDRFGTWTLLLGYFIPGVRHLTAVVAGTSNLRPASFAAFAYSGALIWSATFIGLGYFFGDQWEHVLVQVQHHLVISIALFFIFAVIALIWTYRKKKKNQKQEC